MNEEVCKQLFSILEYQLINLESDPACTLKLPWNYEYVSISIDDMVDHLIQLGFQELVNRPGKLILGRGVDQVSHLANFPLWTLTRLCDQYQVRAAFPPSVNNVDTALMMIDMFEAYAKPRLNDVLSLKKVRQMICKTLDAVVRNYPDWVVRSVRYDTTNKDWCVELSQYPDMEDPLLITCKDEDKNLISFLVKTIKDTITEQEGD